MGFILGSTMLFHYGKVFEVNDLAVLPDYQRKGIATELLERCLADMEERGIKGINLITANEGMLPGFYGKHGFEYFQTLMKPMASVIVSVARGAVVSGMLIYILPAVAGADAVWFAMPVTELLVAVYVVLKMVRYTKAVSVEK